MNSTNDCMVKLKKANTNNCKLTPNSKNQEKLKYSENSNFTRSQYGRKIVPNSLFNNKEWVT